MFSFEEYTDVVPLPVLVMAPLAAGLVFLLCPARLRLPLALIMLPPFLLVGRLPLLGPLALGAKALGFAMLLAVAAAAVLAPGPKRRLSPIAYAYVPLAVVTPVFLLTTEDSLIPQLRTVQWICMVFAGLAVARTVVDSASLMRVLRYMVIGLLINTPILLSAIVAGQWTFTGHGRFEPYGASSSQVGRVYTIAGGFMVYLTIRDRNLLLKLLWAGTAAIYAGMAVLTGSRSVMITLLGSCAPLGLFMLRKPVLAIPTAGILLVGIAVIVSRVDENAFYRYQTLETARGQQAVDYIRESIAQRPLVGLLGSRGLKAEVDEELGFHAHNAYLMMAYTGGLVLAVPYLILAGLSMYCAFYVWKHRRLLDTDPLLISLLAALMFMVYAQGVVNHQIYMGTTIWGFTHLLLSALFLTWAGELSRFRKENPGLATILAQRQPQLT